MNSETKFCDLTGFSADQIASDVLIQLEQWRLAGGLVLLTFEVAKILIFATARRHIAL
ncbi:hypothetical protein [Sphingomonas aerolata]|uniref:hypothetical protein n=1 Tax=Sphingomonas aerolata TaxID=185951 RepID=UPI00142DD688|nr:hypothetical protein [Sphingomonas aerolata]